jgi:hypothetical protein
VVARGVEAGGLKVEDDDLVLEAVDRLASARGQRGICLGDVGIGSRLKKRSERLADHGPKRSMPL